MVCVSKKSALLQLDSSDNTFVYVSCVQHVRVTHSAVAVTDCVFRRVNCVMDTHSAMITVTKPTVLKITVCIYRCIIHFRMVQKNCTKFCIWWRWTIHHWIVLFSPECLAEIIFY